jgi:hypothetical protein
MNINTTNVVSINFQFSKIKKLKLWANKVKKIFKNLKKLASEKIYDILTSDESQEFCLNPVNSRVFSNRIKPLVVRLALSILNVHVMATVETKRSILNYSKSFGNKYSILETLLYTSGIFAKIFFIWTSCSTIRSTTLSVSTLLITYDSKEKIIKNIQVTYFAKGKFLTMFYILSIELKVVDLLYYSLTIIESRRTLQVIGLAKCLRQLDFLILLIIIVIQISFTILDIINSNSNKK